MPSSHEKAEFVMSELWKQSHGYLVTIAEAGYADVDIKSEELGNYREVSSGDGSLMIYRDSDRLTIHTNVEEARAEGCVSAHYSIEWTEDMRDLPTILRSEWRGTHMVGSVEQPVSKFPKIAELVSQIIRSTQVPESSDSTEALTP